jgi:hypothetical protein
MLSIAAPASSHLRHCRRRRHGRTPARTGAERLAEVLAKLAITQAERIWRRRSAATRRHPSVGMQPPCILARYKTKNPDSSQVRVSAKLAKLPKITGGGSGNRTEAVHHREKLRSPTEFSVRGSGSGAPTCSTAQWIPYMSGFRGIGVVLLPNNMAYHFLHISLMALAEVAVIKPSRYGSSMYS